MPDANQTPKPKPAKTLLTWTFPEFVRYARTKRWYTVAGLLTAAAFLWAVFQSNVLFAILLVLAAIVYVAIGQRRPRQITFTVTEDGVSVERDLYPWAELDRFWLVYQPPLVKRLFFRFKTGVRPVLSVLLEQENPVTVRKTLLEYLPEDLHGEEPALDQLARFLKL